ncbi:MAG: hypothetical protein K2O58_02250 [Bacteroidales bacterium]|nr:hypothetical protein [Bacteroidales bacterium]MDE7126703.1 hypothetical protein [Bacteroidales bacterium]
MISKFKLRYRVSVAIVTLDGFNHSVVWLHEGGALSVLLVTGCSVGSRPYEPSDPIVKRIESNAGLFFTLHGQERICYVRKELLEPAIVELEHSGKKVLDMVMSDSMANEDIKSIVEDVCGRRLSFRSVLSDFSVADCMLSGLFRRLRLPVLLSCLAVLVSNWFVFSYLGDRLDHASADRNALMMAAMERTKMTAAQKRLVTEYSAVPVVCIASVADAFAVVLPEGVRLSMLSVNDKGGRHKVSMPVGRPFVIIGGEAVSADAVMSFADSLKFCSRVSAMAMVNLEKDAREGIFRFEISVML